MLKEHQLSILAISETWLTPSTSDGEVNIPDYRPVRRDRAERPGGSVCIYIHFSPNFKLLTSLSNPALEMVWIRVKFCKHNYDIGCLYRHPQTQVQFWSTLTASLEGIEGNDIIIMRL